MRIIACLDNTHYHFEDPNSGLGFDWIDLSDIGAPPLVGDMIRATDFVKEEWFKDEKDSDDFFGNYNLQRVDKRLWGNDKDGNIVLDLWLVDADQ